MSTLIEDLEHRRWQAMIESDLPVLEELLHPNLRYTHSTAVVDSKESYIKAIQEGVFDYRNIETSDVEIQLFGQLALIIGSANITVLARGKEFVLNSRYTCMWMQEENWRFLAWHNTPIPA